MGEWTPSYSITPIAGLKSQAIGRDKISNAYNSGMVG
jgi:hypothetical protein